MHAVEKFHIIRSDVEMPILGRWVRNDAPDDCLRPAIVLGVSDNTRSCDCEVGLRAGVDEYMEKSYTFSEIEALILKHLQLRSS